MLAASTHLQYEVQQYRQAGAKREVPNSGHWCEEEAETKGSDLKEQNMCE
jgi:predicted transport protein